MAESDSLTLVLPIVVERRLGDVGQSTGCSERCPYNGPMSRGLNVVVYCHLFRADVPLNGARRLPDCLAAGLACRDDPHVVTGARK